MPFFKLLDKPWRNDMVRNTRPGSDTNELPAPIYSTLSPMVQCVATCFADCCAGLFYTKPRPKLLVSQQVTQKLKECIDLMVAQDHDMHAIHIALKNSRTDIRAAHRQIPTLLTSYQHQQQYLITQTIESYDKNFENRTGMLDLLSELLDSYPALEPDVETSLDILNVFYNERDAHHQKTITIVETYLPETYAALSEVRPVIKNNNK